MCINNNNNSKEDDYLNKSNIKNKNEEIKKRIKKKHNLKSYSYIKLNKLKNSIFDKDYYKYQLNITNQNDNQENNNIKIKNNKNDNNNSQNTNINFKSFIINKSCEKNKVSTTNKNNIFKDILISLNNDNKYDNKSKSFIKPIKNENFKSIHSKIENNININDINIDSKNNSVINQSKTKENLKIDESSTKKNNLINNNYILTKNFVNNKNNHFAVNPEKSFYGINGINKKKSKNYSKSPMNTISSRTKDKTNRTINKQNNIIINIKQNFEPGKIPIPVPNNNKNNTNKRFKDKNKSKNKSKNKGYNYNYREYIELNELKKNINPGTKVYERQLILKEKKEKKLQEIRKRKDEDELAEIQNIPKIDEISKKITKNNIPIYKRLNEIEKKRKINAEKIRNIMISENEINESTINKKCEKNFDKKNFNKWLLSNMTWNLKRNLKMEKMKNLLDEEKIENENFEFKPKIDKNSERIFYKSNNCSKSPVVKRLTKSKENRDSLIKKIEEEEMLSFRPDINKNYQIRNEYYEFMEDDQAEIYNELKEKIEKEEKH